MAPYTSVQALVGVVALYASVRLLAWYKETELRRRRGLYSRSPGVTRRGPAGEETPLGRVQSPGLLDGRGRWHGGGSQAADLANKLREQGSTMAGISNLSAGCLESLSAAFGTRGLHVDETGIPRTSTDRLSTGSG